jgi:cyclophilin family peptidyl-prolyl cis-trans isomerase
VSNPSNDPIAAIDAYIEAQSIDTTQADWKTKLSRPDCLQFEPSCQLTWTLATNIGELVIRLMPDVAPMHVSSTLFLTRLGFYDDVVFHRVISGFMAQGGDPLGEGFGGPGYQYDGEFSADERHDRPGLLSMANAGPGTDGSQFFITFVPTPHLDDAHTIFGEVVDGKNTLAGLEQRGSGSGATTERLFIEKATVALG